MDSTRLRHCSSLDSTRLTHYTPVAVTLYPCGQYPFDPSELLQIAYVPIVHRFQIIHEPKTERQDGTDIGTPEYTDATFKS